MLRATTMGFVEATEYIGNALANLGVEDLFDNRRFHSPGLTKEALTYKPGKPSIVVDWDGIGGDEVAEGNVIRVPSAMLYEIRILHPRYKQGVKDEYVYAKQMVLYGTGVFFEALNDDRTLGQTVRDVSIEASFVAPMRDSATDEDLYGHQMNVYVRIF